VIKLRPDVILVSREDGLAEDQGRAILLHPAIRAMFPPERRLILPERLTVCGGPMLAEAMRRLARHIATLTPRDRAGR
jgi:iron complex transport system substrate-binding protein